MTRYLYLDVTNLTQERMTDLPPCTWETVKFTYATSQLYRFSPENAHKTRLLVSIDLEADVFTDQPVYGLFALLNNLFGFMGLYLGMGVLELFFIVEKLLSLLWNHRLLEREETEI